MVHSLCSFDLYICESAPEPPFWAVRFCILCSEACCYCCRVFPLSLSLSLITHQNLKCAISVPDQCVLSIVLPHTSPCIHTARPSSAFVVVGSCCLLFCLFVFPFVVSHPSHLFPRSIPFTQSSEVVPLWLCAHLFFDCRTWMSLLRKNCVNILNNLQVNKIKTRFPAIPSLPSAASCMAHRDRHFD